MGCVARILAVRNRHLGSPLRKEELEDLVQETLISIWARLASYRGQASLETWSYRFCELSLSNFLRVQRRKRPQVPLQLADSIALQKQQGLDVERLSRAVEQVGFPASEIVRLRHFEDLSFAEIAERMDLPVSTAKAHYYRALERLRDLLRTEQRGVGDVMR
jgi:RNA polymerase sigma-70 factor (ECF subfamily)